MSEVAFSESYIFIMNIGNVIIICLVAGVQIVSRIVAAISR